MKLVVTHAFGDYKPGDEITDPVKIQEILGGEQAHFVVKVPVSDESPSKKSK